MSYQPKLQRAEERAINIYYKVIRYIVWNFDEDLGILHSKIWNSRK